MIDSSLADVFSAGGEDWDDIRREVFQRDDYTCQRCFHKSGYHTGDRGRELHAHHIVERSDGGSDDLHNLITLCRPCHGIQHPDNAEFDDSRLTSSFLPHPKAENPVAVVASSVSGESIDQFLDRVCTHCRRCGESKDRSRMILYPSAEDSTAVKHQSNRYTPVCMSCASVVVSSDSRFPRQSSHQFICCLSGKRSVSVQAVFDAKEGDIPYFSFHPHERLCVRPDNRAVLWKDVLHRGVGHSSVAMLKQFASRILL